MTPISFTREATLPATPEQIAAQILDLDRWREFEGYGPMPGIRAAEFERRTPQVVGSRVRVTNTDGSTHVEEIIEWDPSRRLRLRFLEFSPPLSRLTTSFEETWEFERLGDGTSVVRSFQMHPRSLAAWPALWLISQLLRKAIAKQLRQMREAGHW